MKCSIETLMEHIKPVVTEKFEFDYQMNHLSQHFWENSDHQNSDTIIKTKSYQANIVSQV